MPGEKELQQAESDLAASAQAERDRAQALIDAGAAASTALQAQIDQMTTDGVVAQSDIDALIQLKADMDQSFQTAAAMKK